MALIKQIQTKYGIIAEYWRIVDAPQNYDRRETAVVLCGYSSKLERDEGAAPLAQVNFLFNEIDHPVNELDPDLIDETLLSEYENFNQHILYQHIKSVATYADTADRELTANEQNAIQFLGAQDDI